MARLQPSLPPAALRLGSGRMNSGRGRSENATGFWQKVRRIVSTAARVSIPTATTTAVQEEAGEFIAPPGAVSNEARPEERDEGVLMASPSSAAIEMVLSFLEDDLCRFHTIESVQEATALPLEIVRRVLEDSPYIESCLDLKSHKGETLYFWARPVNEAAASGGKK